MAEVTYSSAGVYTTEIDQTGPTTSVPSGVPGGIIGTADEGPAYVPITIGSYSDFARIFGATDGEKFGPLAVHQFLKNAQSLTYTRVLGIGDGKKRDTGTGKVTNAGFVVGAKTVQDNGNVGRNPYAIDDGVPGKTYFLGCFMSASAGSTLFTDAGIQKSNENQARPIVRGVLMAPSGVLLRLSGAGAVGNSQGAPSAILSAVNPTAAGDEGTGMVGGITGSVNIATKRFVMLLNGHLKTGDAPNVITASFDLEDASYFANVLNTDPAKIEEKGHLLYSHYDIHPALAAVTGTGVFVATHAFPSASAGGPALEPLAFLTTGSAGRNTGTSTAPDYESFEERFTHAKSPFVISQTFGGTKYSIVRIHALGDGRYTNTNIKISIENIKPSTSDAYKYGTFDLLVRKFEDTDLEKKVLEAYRGANLDPSSDKFIARIIGDMYSYFDFDQASSSQKLVLAGDHPVRSNYIRVEQSTHLKNGQVPKDALPFGFRGPDHLVTSGSAPLEGGFYSGALLQAGFNDRSLLNMAVEPPVPLRKNIVMGSLPNLIQDATWYWGVKFMQTVAIADGVNNTITLKNLTVDNFTKFFPSYGGSNRDVSVGNNPGVADSGGTVLDCDRFNNNIFTLERLTIRTGSDGKADPNEWVSASYTRTGNITANETNKTRALKSSDLSVQGNRTFCKYSFFLQRGFNGSNIFDKDKEKMLNAAVRREMDDSTAQGGTSGPTVSAYRKALDIMGTKSDVDIKLLAIPGIRHSSVSDYAIDTVESRFDAMYVMDIEERDEMNSVITSSVGSFANVSNTVTEFKGRALDTSFAAAYFPDVIMTDPTTHTNVQCPPSVAVMGAMSLNDAVGYPWFAPAGFTRGALGDVLFADVSLNKTNMDDLYDADINPLTAFPNTGVMVFGQKTLLAAASALDRVNVRRLLIDIRRKVRNIANLMLFEPNRQETLDKFSALVQPVLQSIQEKSGVDRFKVVIDATTTTQTDIENNTLRGKIFLQPTRTAEFVALDFVLTNAGDAFENA